MRRDGRGRGSTRLSHFCDALGLDFKGGFPSVVLFRVPPLRTLSV